MGDSEGSFSIASETTVAIRSDIAVRVQGAPLLTEVEWTLEATLTASTSTLAETFFEQLQPELDMEASDDSTLVMNVNLADRANLESGFISIRMPAALGLFVETQGQVEVRDIEGDMTIGSILRSTVFDAQGDLNLQVKNGPAQVESLLNPSTTLNVEVESGDIQLALPARVSARFDATANGGEVVAGHPDLPEPFGPMKTRYTAEVNGGLGNARLLTQAGNIIIGVQP